LLARGKASMEALLTNKASLAIILISYPISPESASQRLKISFSPLFIRV